MHLIQEFGDRDWDPFLIFLRLTTWEGTDRWATGNKLVSHFQVCGKMFNSQKNPTTLLFEFKTVYVCESRSVVSDSL